jgi:hypothetical protein
MTIAMYDVVEPLICCVERNSPACPCNKKKREEESEIHMRSTLMNAAKLAA